MRVDGENVLRDRASAWLLERRSGTLPGSAWSGAAVRFAEIDCVAELMSDLLAFHLVGAFLATIALPGVLSLGLAPPAASAALRTAGLMLVTMLHGVLGSVLPAWQLMTLGASCMVVFGTGLVALRWRMRHDAAGLRLDWRAFGAAEVVFLGAFLPAAWLVAHDPALVGTERLMDYALLNSTATSLHFPPLDPWWAGASLNYYWFGHHMAAVLGQLADVPVERSYNLALAAVFGLAAQLVFGTARALGLGMGGALLVTALTMCAGNLQPVGAALASWRAEGVIGAFDYFAASRVIPHTITEFPLFSLLVGDLHAHFLALPLWLLFIMLLCAGVGARRPERFGQVIAANLVMLATALSNAWGLAGILTLFGFFVICRIGRWPWWSLVPGLVLIPLVWPVQGQGLTIGWVGVAQRSPLTDFLMMWGVPLICIVALVAWRAVRSMRVARLPLVWLVAAVSSWLLVRGVGPAAALCLVMAGLLIAAGREHLRPWAAMGAAGLVLIVIPELVFLRDAYGAPYERMNTVFKFSYAAWPLLWFAAGGALVRAIGSSGAPWRRPPMAWLAVALVGVYPVLALQARIARDVSHPLWDGHAPLLAQHGGDVVAAHWLRAQRAPGDVCLEAPGDSYTWSGRVAAIAACPVPLGWDGHQQVWRGAAVDTARRRADVDTLYTTTDRAVRQALLERYGIRWVVIGEVERQRYDAARLASWDTMFAPVFAHGDTRVYHVGR